MGIGIPTRANARRAAIAVLVLAGILVAPVCTPLCAAKVCFSGTAQGEECHGQGAMEDTGADKYAAPVKACGARELAVVLLRADKRLIQATQLQDLSAEWNIDKQAAESFASFSAPVLRWGEDRFALGPGPTSFLLQTTHLRF